MTTRVLGNYAVRRAGWIAALSIAAVAGSLLFACTTPFAALATFAALYMQRRDAFMVTGITWLANQLVGFGFLHYPHTWTTAAWGIAIGVSALVATALAAGSHVFRHSSRPIFPKSSLSNLTSFSHSPTCRLTSLQHLSAQVLPFMRSISAQSPASLI
jgi:hypothetical protein